jgi:O-antigen/teichoic acid export membrane protein
MANHPLPQAQAPGAAPNPPPTRTLGQQTAVGFAWLMFQTVGVKCVTVLGQVALAWLLIPDDFGLVALAYSVTTFIVILQASGILEILIQRHREFARLASPAFWLSLLIGTSVAVLIVVAAPFAALLYGQPELKGLLLVIAVSTFLSNLENVPIAKLQTEMRFRPLSLLGIFQGAGQTILAVSFAMAGFGAYSFVLPLPIIGLFKLIALWWLARPPVKFRLQLDQWPSLVGASGLLVGAAFFFGLYTQAANIALGLLHSAAVVGLFHFAYHLSLQVQTLLALNLSQVLLPSFSKLQDDRPRQTAAFLRANKILMIIAAPASLLVAAVADPAIRAIFHERWEGAIPVLQLLSFGAAFNLTSIVTMNLLKAQGRYVFHLRMAIWRALGFVTLVTAGGVYGGAVAVAAGAAIFMIGFGPISMYASIKAGGKGFRQVLDVYAVPVGIGGLACAAGAGVAWGLPDLPGRDYVRVAVTTAIAGIIYLPLMRWLAADAWCDLVARVLSILPERMHRFVPRILTFEPVPPRGADA